MRRLLLIPPAACLLLLTAVPAAATPPEDVAGDWTYVPTVVELTKVAGQNMFFDGEDIGTWTGAFEGTSTEDFVIVYHGGAGFNYYSGLIEFTGTVNGSDPGTMIIRTVGTQWSGTPEPTFDVPWNGRWVIISGSEGLANIHGCGTFTGPSLDLDYEGTIHFED
jgi:hypothetical protein